MKPTLVVHLKTTQEQHAKLQALRAAFVAVCNELAPLAQQTACWNRVALHHLGYRTMRERFPAVGSQIVCNAVYSVSRACRLVYQHPKSAFNQQRLAGKPLPLLHFLPTSPVFFDRHTLSLKDGRASMYTLDGRMRFNLPLPAEDELRFRTGKLREIVLFEIHGGFALSFEFGEHSEGSAAPALAATATAAFSSPPEGPDLPEYLVVQQHGPNHQATPASTSQKTDKPESRLQ